MFVVTGIDTIAKEICITLDGLEQVDCLVNRTQAFSFVAHFPRQLAQFPSGWVRYQTLHNMRFIFGVRSPFFRALSFIGADADGFALKSRRRSSVGNAQIPPIRGRPIRVIGSEICIRVTPHQI